MTDAPDAELLEQFARNDSEAAFAELVSRHLALVYSVALRHTADAQHAQDITQAVFIILARKAPSLGRKTVLSGWLYHTARLTAANFRRSEARRIRREQETFMQSTLDETPSNEVWSEIAPLLDEAMSRLGRTDRDAIVLRYFENRNLREVGAALGLRERAAQKRVARSLEKLRAFFARRGVVSTTAIVAGAISANSVQAVPATAVLAKSVTAVAVAKGAAASVSSLTLIKGALKVMAWTKAKTAVVVVVGAVLALGTTSIVVHQIGREPSYNGRTVTEWLDRLSLYDPRRSTATSTYYRDVEEVANDPALKALMQIGPKAIPVLLKQMTAPAEWPRDVGLWSRTKMWTRWKLTNIRHPGSMKRPSPDNYPLFQRNRGNAAGIVLLGIGTDAGGGFDRFAKYYASAPRHKSVYGTEIAGPPLPPTPLTIVKFAKSIFPERRDEIFGEIIAGLYSTNALVREVALECVSQFPEELPKWKERLKQLALDDNWIVQSAALGDMIEITWTKETLAVMPPSEIRRVTEAVINKVSPPNNAHDRHVLEGAKSVRETAIKLEQSGTD